MEGGQVGLTPLVPICTDLSLVQVFLVLQGSCRGLGACLITERAELLTLFDGCMAARCSLCLFQESGTVSLCTACPLTGKSGRGPGEPSGIPPGWACLAQLMGEIAACGRVYFWVRFLLLIAPGAFTFLVMLLHSKVICHSLSGHPDELSGTFTRVNNSAFDASISARSAGGPWENRH